MVYGVPGLSKADVIAMSTRERVWWLERLTKQRQDETKELERILRRG